MNKMKLTSMKKRKVLEAAVAKQRCSLPTWKDLKQEMRARVKDEVGVKPQMIEANDSSMTELLEARKDSVQCGKCFP